MFDAGGRDEKENEPSPCQARHRRAFANVNLENEIPGHRDDVEVRNARVESKGETLQTRGTETRYG